MTCQRMDRDELRGATYLPIAHQQAGEPDPVDQVHCLVATQSDRGRLMAGGALEYRTDVRVIQPGNDICPIGLTDRGVLLLRAFPPRRGLSGCCCRDKGC